MIIEILNNARLHNIVYRLINQALIPIGTIAIRASLHRHLVRYIKASRTHSLLPLYHRSIQLLFHSNSRTIRLILLRLFYNILLDDGSATRLYLTGKVFFTISLLIGLKR